MLRTYTGEISPNLHNKDVLVQGWLHEIRDQSKIKFLLLRDATGIIQLVSKPEDKFFEEVAKIPKESVLEIQGIIKKSDQAPRGVEIAITDYKVLSRAVQSLAIPVIEKGNLKTSLPKRLDFRSLDLRKPENNAVFKIQAALIEGMQEFLNKNNFTQVFTPCIMGVASESGAEVFQINYFKKKAFLRQDPQLHRQLTIAGGIEKLYDIGPSWRAELSHTVRHLCEHRTCAVELAFINDETDTMRIEENVIVSALKKVNEKCKQELELLGIRLKIPEIPFPELRFPKIYDILAKEGKKIYGQDLDIEAQKMLWDYIKKKYNVEFYFINRFPFAIKPFYVMRVDEEPEFARSVDFHFRDLELSSGGQREHRYEKLIAQVKEKKMNPKSVEWFTKFFQYGVPPHGGFAIGIERLTQNLLNLENIREAVLFPRDPERTEP